MVDIISNPVASELLAKIRRRQCRFPTILFSVGTRHCRLLACHSDGIEIDIKSGGIGIISSQN
ncbi:MULTISPECIES: hypothetical protein [unclassified Microcoleus]|uniref:hypothetical protein n=1 Tax=unclassified Microcoleus TaxID=2642155 RepID=UPI001D4D38F9|nr:MULTISPECIES: hypothetical protein [unclassified Microcoleus]MCC3545401.1 hypothetical protein [Microcoleus sp. PH2017_24_DOB_U_A]